MERANELVARFSKLEERAKKLEKDRDLEKKLLDKVYEEIRKRHISEKRGIIMQALVQKALPLLNHRIFTEDCEEYPSKCESEEDSEEASSDSDEPQQPSQVYSLELKQASVAPIEIPSLTLPPEYKIVDVYVHKEPSDSEDFEENDEIALRSSAAPDEKKVSSLTRKRKQLGSTFPIEGLHQQVQDELQELQTMKKRLDRSLDEVNKAWIDLKRSSVPSREKAKMNQALNNLFRILPRESTD